MPANDQKSNKKFDYKTIKWGHINEIIKDQIQRDKNPAEGDLLTSKSKLDFLIISRNSRFFTIWVVVIAISALLSFLLSLYYAGNQINFSL